MGLLSRRQRPPIIVMPLLGATDRAALGWAACVVGRNSLAMPLAPDSRGGTYWVQASMIASVVVTVASILIVCSTMASVYPAGVPAMASLGTTTS